jgi:gliding motility-associated-like protein
LLTTLVQDTTLYAIQRIDGCHSAASAVALKAGTFTPKEVYVANIITPNGDNKNESFMAPDVTPDRCLGQFQSIQIFNRYGKRIFESRNAGFSWNGSGASAGVYYYVLTYSGFTYSGTLSVLY